MMTRKPREKGLASVFRGGAVALSGNLFQYLSRLVLGIVLARALGADQLGLYTLALSVVATGGGVALIGFPNALTRFISASPGDERRTWGLLLFGIGLPTMLGACLGAGVLVGAPRLATHVFARPELEVPLLVAALAIPFFALNRTACYAALGFGRVHYRVIAEDVSRHVFKLALVLSIALFGLTVVRAVAIEVFSLIASCLVILWLLNRAFSLRRSVSDAVVPARELLAFSGPLYVREFLASLGRNVPLLLLGVLAPAASVGLLGVATRVVGASQFVHSAIIFASMPVISGLAGERNFEKLGRYYVSLSQWSLTLYLPLFFGMVLLPEQILSVFGERFADAADALNVLAVGTLVNIGTGLCGVVLTMTGRVWTILTNSALNLILTLVLTFTLVPTFGLLGAAAAIALSVALTNLLMVLEVYVYFRTLPLNSRSGQLFLAAGLAFGAAAGVARIVLGEWTGSVPAYTLGSLAYFGLLWLRGLSAEERTVLQSLSASFRRMGSMLPGMDGGNEDNV